MTIHQLKRELLINKPIHEVFSFFEKAENLEKITPDILKFKIITPLPIEMKKGSLIDYQIKLSGIPMKWRTLIDIYEPPFKFRDIQLKGPYKKWEHLHEFIEKGNQTLMIDTVDYELPFGFIGDLVHKIKVKKQLKDIFDHRNKVIPELIEK
jgi:hypothetical protein